MSNSKSARPTSTIALSELSQFRPIQSFTLIWLDSQIDESDEDFQNSLSQLRRIVTTINTFTDVNRCVEFIDDISNVKVFLIISGALGQSTVPLIHERTVLDTIYVFCGNATKQLAWTDQWKKIQGVFTDIISLCQQLRMDACQCDRNSIPISVTGGDLNHIEPSFMYTQLFKEIFLDMEYDDDVRQTFVEFCRNLYAQDTNELSIIDEFELDYDKHTPIWWYTRECFTYHFLNRALRTQNAEELIHIGYFLRDVHRHIERIYTEQSQSVERFTVYRGQGMSSTEFERVKNSPGGLLAFNSFLCTSYDENVSLGFAHGAKSKPNTVGILFEMRINPSISSAPYARLHGISYYGATEKELIFSMHTIFHIDNIKLATDGIWNIHLTLCDDTANPQLWRLTETLREETSGSTGWHRLASVLLKTGDSKAAKSIYQKLLQRTESNNDEIEVAYLHHRLALIYTDMGEYSKALEYHEKCLGIRFKSLPQTHPSLATSYNNIGLVYSHMGEYSKALEYHEKCLGIRVKSLPPTHPSLATSYNNIGSVYDSMGEYSKALEYHEKCLDVRVKSLPPTHPSLTTSYNNIGLVYSHMGEYSKALEYHEKCLDVRVKSLPPTHPSLATSYNNIGSIYSHMGEYSKALEYYEKCLGILVKSLSPTHPSVATSYNNIGLVYSHIGDHCKAHELHQKALDICLQAYLLTQPHIGICYERLGGACKDLKRMELVGVLYKKALGILKKSLPARHPRLGFMYNKIGELHESKRSWFKAYKYYEKARRIQQECLLSNHPDLATTIHNIGSITYKIGEYAAALKWYAKAFRKRQASLPPKHPSIACTLHGMSLAHEQLNEVRKASSLAEWAVSIAEHSLSDRHPNLQLYRETLQRLQK
jgi:tetratricopeptide (TPR) repeat protein